MNEVVQRHDETHWTLAALLPVPPEIPDDRLRDDPEESDQPERQGDDLGGLVAQLPEEERHEQEQGSTDDEEDADRVHGDIVPPRSPIPVHIRTRLSFGT